MKDTSRIKKTALFVFMISFLALFGCVKTEDALDPENLDVWKIYDQSNGLADNSVWSLFEDDAGNIWAGTLNNGVSKFDGRDWTTYNVSDGLLDNVVYSITQDRDGDMWFGTSGGLSILTDDGWVNIDLLNGLAFEVYTLLKDSEGNIWIGTSTWGLLKFDNADFYQLDGTYSVNVICEDNQNNIWYGTDWDLRKLKNNNITDYTSSDGLPEGGIRALHQDSWGNIWVGTWGGEFVAKLVNGVFKPVSLANGWTNNYLNAITSDNMGNVWFGGVSCGAVKYNGSLMKSYFKKESDGLPDETVLSILNDRKGCLWFGTLEGGIAKYTYTEY